MELAASPLTELELVELPMITHGKRFAGIIQKIGEHRVHQAQMVNWLRAYLPGEWAEKIAADLQAFNALMEELEEVLGDREADMVAWIEYHKTEVKALELQRQEILERYDTWLESTQTSSIR